MKKVLEEALDNVYGEREKAYGHPAKDYERVAKLWSVIFGFEVTPLQAAMCMICVKISRELNAHGRDNLVDIAGYAEVCQRIIEGEKPENFQEPERRIPLRRTLNPEDCVDYIKRTRIVDE